MTYINFIKLKEGDIISIKDFVHFSKELILEVTCNDYNRNGLHFKILSGEVFFPTNQFTLESLIYSSVPLNTITLLENFSLVCQ